MEVYTKYDFTKSIEYFPVPPLSDYLGMHQRSKNVKLGDLLRKIHMSSKFEKRGSILAYNSRNMEKGVYFLQLLSTETLNPCISNS